MHRIVGLDVSGDKVRLVVNKAMLQKVEADKAPTKRE